MSRHQLLPLGWGERERARVPDSLDFNQERIIFKLFNIPAPRQTKPPPKTQGKGTPKHAHLVRKITALKGKSRNYSSSGFMGGKKQTNTKEFAGIFFLPNLGSEAGSREDRGRWKGASGTSEQAASLLASRSCREGPERGRKERRGEGGGREGRRGWSEGTRKAVCKLEEREREREKKHSRRNPARSQAVRKQAAAERARARAPAPARVLSAV